MTQPQAEATAYETDRKSEPPEEEVQEEEEIKCESPEPEPDPNELLYPEITIQGNFSKFDSAKLAEL